MKFYSFHKRHLANGQGQMHWFTSKAEAESKLRIEVKNNPYDEYTRDNVYSLSDSADCYNIPTDKKGLLRFLLIHVNIDGNQYYPLEITQ